MSFLWQLIIVLGFALVIATALAMASMITIKEIERGVVLTLGRYSGTRAPGLRFILPAIQKIEIVDIRLRTVDVLPQNIITKDNVRVTVNAVINYQIYDPRAAVIDVEDVVMTTREMAQAILRNAVQGQELDDIADPKRLGADIAQVLDKRANEWGVRVKSVEIKELEVDPTMVRAIAQQAEAERRRRAKIIESEAEVQSARNLSEAAKILESSPGAMQLRYLGALSALGNDRTSTIVFPFPTDLAQMLGKKNVDLSEITQALIANSTAAE